MKYLILFTAAVGLSYLYNVYTPGTLMAVIPAMPVGMMILLFMKDLEKKRKA